jgi:hypothetical protein
MPLQERVSNLTVQKLIKKELEEYGVKLNLNLQFITELQLR